MNLQKYISHKVNRLGWFTSPKRPYPHPPIHVKMWNCDGFALRRSDCTVQIGILVPFGLTVVVQTGEILTLVTFNDAKS